MLRTDSRRPACRRFRPSTDGEAADLIAFVRTLRPRNAAPPSRSRFTLTDGKALEGLVLNRTHADVQVLGSDQRIHLLRPDGERPNGEVSRGDVAGRLALLQRRPERQPLQRARPRSIAARSSAWRRSGCSPFRTPRACRSRRSSWAE